MSVAAFVASLDPRLQEGVKSFFDSQFIMGPNDILNVSDDDLSEAMRNSVDLPTLGHKAALRKFKQEAAPHQAEAAPHQPESSAGDAISHIRGNKQAKHVITSNSGDQASVLHQWCPRIAMSSTKQPIPNWLLPDTPATVATPRRTKPPTTVSGTCKCEKWWFNKGWTCFCPSGTGPRHTENADYLCSMMEKSGCGPNASETLRSFVRGGDGEKLQAVAFSRTRGPALTHIPDPFLDVVLTPEQADRHMKTWSLLHSIGEVQSYAMTAWTDQRIMWVTQFAGSTTLHSAPLAPPPFGAHFHAQMPGGS